MKKIIFSLVSFVLGVVLFFWVLNQTEWQEIKITLTQLSVIESMFLLFLGALGILLGTLRWREILKNKEREFSLRELYGSNLASFAITYLAPAVVFGRELFKGYVLGSQKKDSASFEKGMAASFIDGIFEFLFEWLAIFSGIASFFLIAGFSFHYLLLLVFIVFLFAIIVFLGHFILRKKSILKILFNIDENHMARAVEKEILIFFKTKNRTFKRVLLISFLKSMLRLLQYWILIAFLGTPISLLSALSVFGISILSMAPPVSADLGTHDLGSAILFQKLGMGGEKGVVFASIVRGINLVLSLAGIFFLLRTGLGMLRRKLFNIIDRIVVLSNSNNQKKNEKSGIS
jgi:uncharacterized protein (TIRG00374 family)